MALDQQMAERQLRELRDWADRLEETERELRRYRKDLGQAWSAPEILSFTRTVEGLEDRCLQLRRQLRELRQAAEAAVEEILAEEAAEAAAQADQAGEGE